MFIRLPNIRGSLGVFVTNNKSASNGCMAVTEVFGLNSGLGTGVAVGANRLTIAASASNSVYTDSGRVYPLSLALNFIIKA